MGMRLRRVMTCMGGETWVQEDGRDEWCMGTKVVENSISMHGHAKVAGMNVKGICERLGGVM